MSGVVFIVWGIVLLLSSGLIGCLFPARSSTGQRAASLAMAAGGVLGLYGMAAAFGEPHPPSLTLPGFFSLGRFAVAVDGVSLLFLAPVFVLPALGSFYGWQYWKPSEHPLSGRRLGLAYGFLAGGMALVVIARDGVLFLTAWELMAIAAYFAATAEESNPEVRRAGWVYLVATHMGTLCLFAMFALWRHATGSFALEPAQSMDAGTAGAIFLLALVGFGFKAGLMPLHVWLPGAHANAPSHVSAVMSGVMLKMGVYGIVRLTGLLPGAQHWWGGALLGIGALSGLAGIAFAIGQRDMKRLLAYSSIENIGIIAMGLGLAVLGRSTGRPDWVLLGMGGALFHVWNHSLFKSLLFFNAGAVIHATGTRQMDLLGGLAKRMPRAATAFGVGALAICALPPFNGFASEWLLYLGFFSALDQAAGRPGAAAAVGAVALATIGALAVACFVKLSGTVFLGAPRSKAALGAHEPRKGMLLPMVVLAAGCAGLGLFPMAAAPVLERAVQAWAGPKAGLPALSALAPAGDISLMGLFLLGTAGVLAAVLSRLPGKARRQVVTWDCGYAQPTPRMEYTGSSLGQTLVTLFSFVLSPRSFRPLLKGFFPAKSHLETTVPDVVLDRLAVPFFQALGGFFSSLRIMQQGQTHLYLIYIITIMFTLFVYGSL